MSYVQFRKNIIFSCVSRIFVKYNFLINMYQNRNVIILKFSISLIKYFNLCNNIIKHYEAILLTLITLS